MALADVFDALISRRVNKPPMPVEQARDIIVGERGSHFDPDVVDAFRAIRRFRGSRREISGGCRIFALVARLTLTKL